MDPDDEKKTRSHALPFGTGDRKKVPKSPDRSVLRSRRREIGAIVNPLMARAFWTVQKAIASSRMKQAEAAKTLRATASRQQIVCADGSICSVRTP